VPDIKKLGNQTINALIMAFLVINAYILLSRTSDDLFGDIVLQKPTIALVIGEHDCLSCIHDLQIFNDLYPQIQSENDMDILAIIVSNDRTDTKNFSHYFDFPTITTDNVDIFKKIGHKNTPLILGLSKNKEIFFMDVLPLGTILSHGHIMDTLIDRLYYARNLSSTLPQNP